MSKRVFTAHERYGIWNAHGNKCSWCFEPVVFKLVEIDHILPEKLEGNDKELTAAKTALGLDENFQLNSYQNWLPICSRCNKTKGSKVFEPSPIYLNLLQSAANKAEKAKNISLRLASDRDYGARIEALVEAGQQTGLFTREFWDQTKEAGDRFYRNEPRPTEPIEIPLTPEVSLSLTKQGVKLIRGWMSITARTALPAPAVYLLRIDSAIKNIAAMKKINLLGNLLIDSNALFNEGLINQDQMTFLVRAIHSIEECKGKDVAELTDPELFSAQSTAIQALNSLKSIPESGVQVYL